jgi:hypothetical protein
LASNNFEKLQLCAVATSGVCGIETYRFGLMKMQLQAEQSQLGFSLAASLNLLIISILEATGLLKQ